MTPLIINLDSAFDWMPEVRQIWERLDWDGIRQRIAPQISAESWLRRANEIGMVGLVSSLAIDDCYHLAQWDNIQEEVEEHEDPLSRDWRERQLGRGKCEQESGNNRPRQRSRFNEEEPFFRSPRIGRAGVVECYGIYVDEAATILGSRGLLHAVPDSLHQAPAIFLCPERILDIYSTVIRLGEDLRHPLSLSGNPMLVNLRMTLLHELGHHFFPVHRAESGRFVSEALANLFCSQGLDQEEQAWLLYKSWHLQPPEYSAYRPLNVLCEADADCHSAVATCFNGDLAGWTCLPEKDGDTLELTLGASLTMALAADAAACKGLWWDELRQIVSDENRWFLCWEGNHLHFHINRRDDENIPADFVLDLYRKNNLAHWATREDLPSSIWGRWAYGNKVRWPHDCITVAEADAGKWLAYYASAKNTQLASVICEKLVPLLRANSPAANQPTLRAALDRALAVATNQQANWFDRVPAIQLIETCADGGAISTLEAELRQRGLRRRLPGWMLARYVVKLESIVEKGSNNVSDAASRAVASLRAALQEGGAA